jgi:hypothetical protein
MHFPSCAWVIVLAALGPVGCAEGAGSSRRGRDDGLPSTCTADGEECPAGLICAAVDGLPRCVDPSERLPPGDGTDCRPCAAPGECRDEVCVQPTRDGSICEFDDACESAELCISGRCTPDPRMPIPCDAAAMCAAPLTCVEGTCRCATTTDCALGLLCSGGLCVPGPEACVADADCEGGAACEAGLCVPRSVCDIEHPSLAGTWSMTSTLRLREALSSSLSSTLDAVSEPFRFIAGDIECIDWDDLPGWVDTEICEIARPLIEDHVPPWARTLFGTIADLNDVISTWEIDERMDLEPGAVADAYRGRHHWLRVRFMYRDRPIVGDPTTVLDWSFEPSDFNASAVCGQLAIQRHDIEVSLGSLVRWIVETVIWEASDGRYRDVRMALGGVGASLCSGIARAAEAVDYAGVEGTVRSVCSALVSEASDRVADALESATHGGDVPIGGPNTLRGGHWDGTLLGSGFTGDFDAVR